jgi:hypothetical protein
MGDNLKEMRMKWTRQEADITTRILGVIKNNKTQPQQERFNTRNKKNLS